MKSVKNVDFGGGDLSSIAEYHNESTIPAGCVMLNKDLLPSKGTFYPGDLYIKKLSTIDIKNLSTINEENVNGVINTVLSRCVIGVSVNDILLSDKLWFIFYLRSITYNDMPMTMKYKCPNCNKSEVYSYTLKDIEVSYINPEFEETIKFPSGNTVRIAYPTIGNEIQSNRIKNDPNILEAIDGELLDIACYFRELNGKKLTLMHAYEYVRDMDAMDFSYFVNLMNDFMVGIKPQLKIECTCGEEIEKKIQFTSEFFMPKIVK